MDFYKLVGCWQVLLVNFWLAFKCMPFPDPQAHVIYECRWGNEKDNQWDKEWGSNRGKVGINLIWRNVEE